MSSDLTREPGPVSAVAERARARARTVGVVDDAADRASALVAIGRALDFPAYYGANLDALEECLNDLSWLPEGPVALVLADDRVRDADPAGHRTLLAVLEDVPGPATRPLSVRLVGEPA